jgi:4,5-DOPA dioxygenase extradiol
MERRDFVGLLAMLPFAGGAMQVSELVSAAKGKDTGDRLPVLFLGHGSPMNGIEDNEFSASWKRLGKEIPSPKAVLAVSAHWLTRGTQVTAMERPRTIHDFGGFPQALFDVRYPAPGSPALAKAVQAELAGTEVGLDGEWGLDHGTWTLLRHAYPKADVPVLQLSIDYARPPQWHYDLGRRLAGLRRKGFLIVGSGNLVHNLRMAAFDRLDEEYGYDWALALSDRFRGHLRSGNHAALVDYPSLGPEARLAIPTPDHYYPLLYVLGAMEKGEEPVLFNDKAMGGSITMTSLRTA